MFRRDKKISQKKLQSMMSSNSFLLFLYWTNSKKKRLEVPIGQTYGRHFLPSRFLLPEKKAEKAYYKLDWDMQRKVKVVCHKVYGFTMAFFSFELVFLTMKNWITRDVFSWKKTWKNSSIKEWRTNYILGLTPISNIDLTLWTG